MHRGLDYAKPATLLRMPDETPTVDRERKLRESQAHLAGIIASAMDAIITVNEEHKVTIFNSAAERMFGWKASEALGKPLDVFIPPRFREAHRKYVREFGETGETTRAMRDLPPLSGLRANGEEFPIEASISQAELSGQRFYTVILRDITERKGSEERIRSLNAELELRVRERTEELSAANRELEGFAYSVAHDLRAPLRHMEAFSRILMEDFSDALPLEAQRYLKAIRDSSRTMSCLVEDLLNLARIGRQELSRQFVDLNELVQVIVDELHTDNPGREIDWRVDRLPILECDPGLMKQVLVNLLANAVKYTRHRPKALIEIGPLEVRGEHGLFIRDNGVGFDMKYADRLFGVFQRLHRAEEFEGTGVGLAIVNRIVCKHGGVVWAEAAVDRGATFYFTVPKAGNTDASA